MTPIKLTPSECRHGALVGIGRDLSAKRQGRTPLIPGSNTFLGHITGALGELAVAKTLGVWWQPNVGGNDHNCGDVGAWQVRASSRNRLVVRDRDRDDQAFVFVTGQPPCLCIAGWMYAYEAKELGGTVDAGALHAWEERPWV